VRCDGNFCRGITWSDQSKSSMILGNSEILGRLLMTCNEAMLEIMRDSLYQFYEGTGVARSTTRSPISTENETVSSRDPRASDRSEGAIVRLFHHQGLEHEKRVRVHAKLLKQAEPTKYSLMLDTGCDESYMRIRGDNCRREHGYRDFKGLATTDRRTIQFGAIDYPHHVDILKKVDETMSLQGWDKDFQFSIVIGLTEVCDESVDTGLLGAARGSHFSKAAGTFAYLPSSTDVGSILIGGSHPWESYCEHGRLPLFVPVQRNLSKIHWIVEGASFVMSSNQSLGKRVRHNWLVDTGATHLSIPPDIYTYLVDRMKDMGSELLPSEGRYLPVLTNCSRNRSSFPPVYIRAGKGDNIFTTTIQPHDYTTKPSRSSGKCQLILSKSEPRGLKNTYYMGEQFLRRVLTVFSESRAAVGFCKPTF
jgi:hypothetical protein